MFKKRNKTKKYILVIMAICFSLTSTAAVSFAATTSQVDEVASEFICNCGCNKMLPACNMNCGKNLRKKIAAKIDEGMPREKIISYMKENFGGQILAAPEAKGSGWTAWITPFIALVLGALALFFILSAWARASAKKTALVTAGPEPGHKTETKKTETKTEEDKYKKKIDEELKDIDW